MIKQQVILFLFVKNFMVLLLLENWDNSSTDTYNNAGGLSANDIIDKNIRDLKIKLPHNKLLMALNSLIDFCYDAGESKYINIYLIMEFIG